MFGIVANDVLSCKTNARNYSDRKKQHGQPAGLVGETVYQENKTDVRTEVMATLRPS